MSRADDTSGLPSHAPDIDQIKRSIEQGGLGAPQTTSPHSDTAKTAAIAGVVTALVIIGAVIAMAWLL